MIAIFYSGNIDVDSLLIADRPAWSPSSSSGSHGVRSTLIPLALGVGLWLALEESGVHATIAGVILGLLAPTRPHVQRELVDVEVLSDISSARAARETASLARQSVSVVEWLEHVLHPWTSFVIVPLFALANAGITLSTTAISDAATSRVAIGVLLGLVVGKLVGISAVHLAGGPAEHRRRSRKGRRGGASPASRPSPGSASPSRSSSPTSPSTIRRSRTRPRSAILAAAVVAGGIGALILSRASSDP